MKGGREEKREGRREGWTVDTACCVRKHRMQLLSVTCNIRTTKRNRKCIALQHDGVFEGRHRVLSKFSFVVCAAKPFSKVHMRMRNQSIRRGHRPSRLRN